MSASEPATPHELGGRFEIVSRLKSGHGVETLRARDRQSGAEAVLRTSPIDQVSTGAWLRLEHDTEALARDKRGPRALAFGRAQGLVFTARPFFAGETLASRLARMPLDARETLEVARGLLAELRAAHAHGVVHRDLKPSNVIVGAPTIRAEEVKLVDFGLARSERLEGRSAGESARLARYFSPEQAGLLEHAVDERSDLYALGLILYECLAGTPPFAADTLGEMLRLHLSALPPPLQIGAPRALEELIQRLLKKDPRERYQSAAGALADATQLASQLDAGVAEPVLLIGLGDARTTLLEPAFVGRERELTALERELLRASAGAGALAIVEAESGGGKSRFLDEVARRSVRAHAWVLRGQGLDQGAQRPFQLLAGVFDELLSRTRADALFAARLRDSLAPQAEALREAVPALAGLFPPSPALGDAKLGGEQHGEVRSQEALAALLCALGEHGRPAVLLLDDCQWADEPALKLLARLERRAQFPHLLIAISFRSEAVTGSHPLRQLRPEVHLSFQRLAPGELRDLAQSMAGVLPEEALRAVEELSEGSPFMASAVLRGLVESGALAPDARAESTAPDPAQDLPSPTRWRIEPSAMADLRASQRDASFLARRLSLLPPLSLELLTVGAVLGKQFQLQAAGALCGLSAAAILPAIAAARQRHIVWLRGDDDCVFVHDKLRESLLSRLAPAARAELHLKAAHYLESQPGDRAFEIAFHFDAAGEHARALPFALGAARSARARFALELAERQYRIAQRGAANAPVATRLNIAEGLGDVLLLRGSYDDAEAELTLASSLAGDVLHRANLEGKLGDLAFKRGDVTTAARRLEGALTRLGRHVPKSGAAFTGLALWEIAVQTAHTLFPRAIRKRALDAREAERDLAACRLYSRLAYVYWFLRGKVPCLWVHLRGMNLAERYAATPELAQAWSEHAPVMSMVPKFERGLHYAKRSLEIRRSLHDVWGEGQSLHFMGVILYGSSRYRDCLEVCREAVRVLERTGDRWEGNTAAWHIAISHYRLGELREAAQEARAVYEAARESGDHQASGIALSIWAKASGGRVPRAAVEAALSRAGEDVHTRSEVLTAQALLLLQEKKSAAAVEALERAQQAIDQKGLTQEYVAAVLPWLLTARLRELEETPHWAERRRAALLAAAEETAARALANSRVYRNNLPHALRGAAEVSAARGQPQRARALLEESVAIAREQEARAEEALSLRALAWLDAAEGKPGAEDDEQRSLQTLRALGALEESSRPETLSLTDRFSALLEVGRQIATALTPSEIEAAVERAARRLWRCQSFRFVRLDPSAPTAASLPALLSFSEAALAEAALASRAPVVRGQGEGEQETSERIRSALCAPVLVRGAVRAIFFVTHAEPGVLGEDEQRLASFIASLAGAALENCDGIGQLQRVERDLGMAEKMAALGTLAAGVAHEINNPLSYVLTNLDFVPQELEELSRRARLEGDPQLEEVRQAMREAREGAERVSDIVRDLKLYSSPDEQTPQAVDVTRSLEAMITLAKAELRHRAKLLRDFQPVPPVVASETRLGQVFLNLLINAAQAIPEGNSDANEVRVSTRTDGDGFARIEISDTGSGIPEAIRARIFDPFFTTKQVGVGTGLGLSICMGIVRSLGGDISVESEVGRGTTFVVRLPPAPEGARVAATPSLHVSNPGRALRVLVIDDEPAIGAGLTRMLSGHKVTVELRARPALERLLAGEKFEVILCDLMMPDMGGIELFTELAARMPQQAARVAFITGGAITGRGREFLARTRNRVFEKPLDPNVLRAWLAEAAALP